MQRRPPAPREVKDPEADSKADFKADSTLKHRYCIVENPGKSFCGTQAFFLGLLSYVRKEIDENTYEKSKSLFNKLKPRHMDNKSFMTQIMSYRYQKRTTFSESRHAVARWAANVVGVNDDINLLDEMDTCLRSLINYEIERIRVSKNEEEQRQLRGLLLGKNDYLNQYHMEMLKEIFDVNISYVTDEPKDWDSGTKDYINGHSTEEKSPDSTEKKPLIIMHNVRSPISGCTTIFDHWNTYIPEIDYEKVNSSEAEEVRELLDFPIIIQGHCQFDPKKKQLLDELSEKIKELVRRGGIYNERVNATYKIYKAVKDHKPDDLQSRENFRKIYAENAPVLKKFDTSSYFLWFGSSFRSIFHRETASYELVLKAKKLVELPSLRRDGLER